MKNANTNPWYVLMTLFGEQDDVSAGGNEPRGYNEELHERNRQLWNAWVGQPMSAEAREEVGALSKVPNEELTNEDLDWPEIEKRHRSVMIERNGAGFVYPGFPGQQGGIDLIDLEFEHMLCLSGFYLPLALLIKRSLFRKGVHSPGAMFANGAYFLNVEIIDSAEFGSSWFQRSKFESCKFHSFAGFQGVEFKEKVTYSEVSFHRTANFYLTDFVTEHPEPDFNPIRVKFDQVEFQVDAVFVGSEFGDITRFHGVKFHNGASFYKAKFNFGIHFSQTEFRNRANFGEAQFLLDRAGTLPNFCADAIAFGYVDFEAPTSFERAKFAKTWPSFESTSLHSDTVFTPEDEYWPDEIDGANLVGRKACAKIRSNQSSQGLVEAEHYFFRKEMAFQMNSLRGAKRLLFFGYGFFSNFGHSINRPLWSLFILWLVGAAAFFGFLNSCCVPSPSEIVPRPLGTAMALSFSNLFPVFGFGRTYLEWVDLPVVLQLYSAAQTVFSLPLLFFLALGLRQQFKLDR